MDSRRTPLHCCKPLPGEHFKSAKFTIIWASSKKEEREREPKSQINFLTRLLVRRWADDQFDFVALSTCDNFKSESSFSLHFIALSLVKFFNFKFSLIRFVLHFATCLDVLSLPLSLSNGLLIWLLVINLRCKKVFDFLVIRFGKCSNKIVPISTTASARVGRSLV